MKKNTRILAQKKSGSQLTDMERLNSHRAYIKRKKGRRWQYQVIYLPKDGFIERKAYRTSRKRIRAKVQQQNPRMGFCYL